MRIDLPFDNPQNIFEAATRAAMLVRPTNGRSNSQHEKSSGAAGGGGVGGGAGGDHRRRRKNDAGGCQCVVL